MFVEKFMPCVNKEWADEGVRTSSLLSKVTSPSDEALIITSLEKKGKIWFVDEERLNDNLQTNESDILNNKKKGRDVWTDDDIHKFYERQIIIVNARKKIDTGINWDKGFQEYVLEKFNKTLKSRKQNNNLLKEAFAGDTFDSSIMLSPINHETSQQTNLHKEEAIVSFAEYNIPLELDLDDDN
jgi:hypothetical protein